MDLPWHHDRWLHLPTFGLAREHQERWQHLAQAYQDYQHRVGEYDQLMLKVAQDAFVRFERKLEEHAEPGRQPKISRIELYREMALSVAHVFSNGRLRKRFARFRRERFPRLPHGEVWAG